MESATATGLKFALHVCKGSSLVQIKCVLVREKVVLLVEKERNVVLTAAVKKLMATVPSHVFITKPTALHQISV